MKKNTFIHLLTFLAVFLLFTFCTAEEDDCPDTNVPDLYASFVKNDNKKIDKVIIYSEQLTDSIYNDTLNPDSINIPLKLSENKTNLTFDVEYEGFEEKFSGELEFIHQHSLSTTNIECGFTTQFLFKEINYNSSLIDSVEILDTIINTDIKIHAKIYYSNHNIICNDHELQLWSK